MSVAETLGQNKAVVAAIMWNLEVFTLPELTSEYYRRLGKERSDYLGDGQRIRDYVEEMCDFGVLSEWFGTYTHIDKQKSREKEEEKKRNRPLLFVDDSEESKQALQFLEVFGFEVVKSVKGQDYKEADFQEPVIQGRFGDFRGLVGVYKYVALSVRCPC